MITQKWHTYTAGTWTLVPATVMACSVLRRLCTLLTTTHSGLIWTATDTRFRSQTSALDRRALLSACPSTSTSHVHASLQQASLNSQLRSRNLSSSCATSFCASSKAIIRKIDNTLSTSNGQLALSLKFVYSVETVRQFLLQLVRQKWPTDDLFRSTVFDHSLMTVEVLTSHFGVPSICMRFGTSSPISPLKLWNNRHSLTSPQLCVVYAGTCTCACVCAGDISIKFSFCAAAG